MYNAAMADDDMLDTQFLFQPRGPGAGWCFRMLTPPVLIGRTNPRTGRPYGREIRMGLDTRRLKMRGSSATSIWAGSGWKSRGWCPPPTVGWRKPSPLLNP